MDCFAPFSASGNARIRLSSRRGGEGREDYFAGNASSSVGLTECFSRSNIGRVLLDSKGEGGGRGEGRGEWTMRARYVN